MRTYTVKTTIYGNRSSRLCRAANAARYAEMAAQFRASQRNAGTQDDMFQDDILQPTYDEMPADDNSDQSVDSDTGDESNQQLECPWVNLSEEVTKPIDLLLRSRIEQHRHEATQFNFRSIIEMLHPTYLALKYRTENWSGVDASKSFVNCKCAPHTFTKRIVDTVDLLGQHRRQMNFCRCTHNIVWLLQQGYLAGSPVQPQTAFSMQLMIFHNNMWNHCHVGAMPFTEALREWLERHSPNQKIHQPRDLRKPFSVAVDFLRHLNNMTDSLVMKALKLNKQEKLAVNACPACFGPTPPNSDQYPETMRNQLVICLDGNLQHRHHTKASREEVIRTPDLFLEQREVDAMLGDICLAEIRHQLPSQLPMIGETSRHGRAVMTQA
ncbi:hypothetical protein PCASD_20547 [Puccinia coronata f. sp. avenae]|uniref:CxC1-like cysteine cluster associated with KDZ transposases domain-containing protein n=1 Tax=Puccinia coronata f. sp. avenae TaxID=200324 RepID=A0A2N5T146_9BASI|nr:hypothetical protein PCASD_20547 [Puccinia coronata f. sp. avenae]